MKDLALIGKKIGMTREFLNSGQSVPVTVVQMEKGRIINIIENPIENKIVFKRTTFLFCSISFKLFPVM